MSRFIDPKRYPTLFKALVAFLKMYSFDEALRLLCTAAEASGKGDLYQRWALREGERLREVTSAPPAAWLKHKSGTRTERLDASIPGADHLRYIVQPDGTRIALNQPYALSWGELVALVTWCQGRDLEASIDAYSGHFPGRTLAVRITRGDA